jgi:hypothetical protein
MASTIILIRMLFVVKNRKVACAEIESLRLQNPFSPRRFLIRPATQSAIQPATQPAIQPATQPATQSHQHRAA